MAWNIVYLWRENNHPVRDSYRKKVSFSEGSKINLFKYIHIVNDLRELTGKKIDLVEDGQLKPFARESAEHDKILIYERKNG